MTSKSAKRTPQRRVKKTAPIAAVPELGTAASAQQETPARTTASVPTPSARQRPWPTLPATAVARVGRADALTMLAILLASGLVTVLLALIFTPWQQTVRGAGRVVAYAPLERQQRVEAPIKGRVVAWHVREGEAVKKGDVLAELADNDAQIVDRLLRERDAARVARDAASLSLALTEARVQAQEAARDASRSSARQKVLAAEAKAESATQKVASAEATERTATQQFERQTALHTDGLVSDRKLELATMYRDKAVADLAQARAGASAAKAGVSGAKAELAKTLAKTDSDVAKVSASYEKARADRAKADAALAKVEVRLARQSQMQVRAPRDGTVLRVLAKQGTEMVKAGDALLTLVPTAAAPAVEIYVDGNDAPLVTKGRHVRLQFEGWPAIQFTGWPSVAVGTFGGVVDFVDGQADAKGRFRVMVVPEEDTAWPEERYLRQGVRAAGWVMLNQVALGFEIWRQLNGFPPAVKEKPELGEKAGKAGSK